MQMEGGALTFVFLVLSRLLGRSASQECHGVLTDPVGEIHSPGYPGSYPPNVDCQWVIQALATQKILLSFNYFNLEEHADCLSGDYLYVSDPEGDSHIFCGSEDPGTIESVGNTLYVHFISDEDDESGFGFSATYMAMTMCEGGWEGFGSHCYFFSEEEMAFDEARTDCEARNGQLTSIHSREEQLFIQELAKTGTVWIGATNTGLLGEDDDPFGFEFLDGTPSDYHNVWQWVTDRPLSSCSSGCGTAMVPDRWTNLDCTEHRPVICESVQSHGDDWYCFDDPVCFHVSTRSFDFDAGRSYCLDFWGADILSIGATERHQAILALCFEHDDRFPHPLPKWSEFWVGLRQDPTGDWSWADGSPVDVDRWDEGSPVAGGGDCAVTVTSSWDDLQGSYPASYVCKMSPRGSFNV